MVQAQIQSAEVLEHGLRVVFAGIGAPEEYSWFWLRDHSEDASRFNIETRQRTVDTFTLDPSVRGTAAEMRGSSVHVRWSDGSPDGIYSAGLLAAVAGLTGDQLEPRPWPRPPAAEAVQRFEFDDVVGTQAGLRAWLDHVAAHGYGLVRNMPAGEEGAATLARRVGYPRETIFGGMWTLSSEMKDHNDTAYTQTYLEPHTDSTYSHDAPGLQLFCCVERDGTGGESILVDGFAIADEIRRDDPEAFEVLTTVVVKGHYLEPGVHLVAERPPIRLRSDDTIEQVTFNNYDRAPFRLPHALEPVFYRAYGEFHRRMIDRSRWLQVRLDSGDALLFDNWRTLHGRMAYVGRRVFVGCYHNREDFESVRRVLASTSDV